MVYVLIMHWIFFSKWVNLISCKGLSLFFQTPELFEVIQQFELEWFKTKAPRQLMLRNQQISAALMPQPTDKQFTNCLIILIV